jgi:DNA-binding transcriptional MerR regulator
MSRKFSANSPCQIGTVARESGASIDTIRYYEKFGLVEEPIRGPGEFRKYPVQIIEQIRFIKKAQALGFTLREIKSVIRCSRVGLKPCCDLVRQLLEKKLSEFETQIKDLQRMRRQLESILQEWIPPGKARKRAYTVCPQLEREPKTKRR